SDPTCTALPERHKTTERRIGRLYRAPRMVCECGSRILELLYCYQCGEVFLGGYADSAGAEHEWYMNPGPTAVPAKEVEIIFRRRYGEYMWYWPGGVRRHGSWTHTHPSGTLQLSFAPALLSP